MPRRRRPFLASRRLQATQDNQPMLPADLAKKKERLLAIIKQKSILKGHFKLASGETSDYYLDMRPTTFDAEGANLVADLVYDMLRGDDDVEAVGGLELGSVPVIVGVAMRSFGRRPLAGFVVRKQKKGHGTDQQIDGNFRPGSVVVLLEDVTTKGGSVMQAVNAVRQQGATVKKIITIVDRLQGAAENLKKEGIDLVAVFTAPQLLG
jgi:orotate phosphoribosyltransferase